MEITPIMFGELSFIRYKNILFKEDINISALPGIVHKLIKIK